MLEGSTAAAGSWQSAAVGDRPLLCSLEGPQAPAQTPGCLSVPGCGWSHLMMALLIAANGADGGRAQPSSVRSLGVLAEVTPTSPALPDS